MPAAASPRDIQWLAPRRRLVGEVEATSIARGSAYLIIAMVLAAFWGAVGYLAWSLLA